MDLFNKVYIFEPMKGHTYEPNLNLISLISLMFNYAKPRIYTVYIPYRIEPSDMKTKFGECRILNI